MTQETLYSTTINQLNLVLSFFQRVDSKLSVVFAVDTGMLAILATNAPSPGSLTAPMLAGASVTVALVAISLAFWYRGTFPHLKGGHASLVYFGEIAGWTEHKFIEAFRAQSDDERVNDLLGQVWRNSEILKKKFDSLKVAFVLTAVAVVPWIISLALFAAFKEQSSPASLIH